MTDVSGNSRSSLFISLRALVYFALILLIGLSKPEILFNAFGSFESKATVHIHIQKVTRTQVEHRPTKPADFYDYHKGIALTDFYNKISPDFRPSRLMKRRVGFWFDVYAKYHKDQHIVHHSLYPWIVYEVVDTSKILNNKRLHRWTRYHRSKNLIKKRRKALRNAMKSLSKRRNFKRLNSNERIVLKALKPLRGKLRWKAQVAAKNLRSQTGQRTFFAEGLQRYVQWIEPIEATFKKYRLPLELTRLPFVESSFNPKAVSKVGASGIWQIMPAMGKKFLTVNSKVDERNDPVKAAKAAALLLRENKMLLKKWPLAVTAYNTGAGAMKRAIKSTKSHRIESVISRFKSIGHGFASNNFFASFVAALHVEKYQYLFFEPLNKVDDTKEIAENEQSDGPGA